MLEAGNRGQSPLGRAIRRVGGRLTVVRFARWWYWAFLGSAALYALVLLVVGMPEIRNLTRYIQGKVRR